MSQARLAPEDPMQLSFIDPQLFSEHSSARGSLNITDELDVTRKRKAGTEGDTKMGTKKHRTMESWLSPQMVRTTVYAVEGKRRMSRWICCHSCHKWRRVSNSLPFESLAGWECSRNAHAEFDSCEKVEEQPRSNEVILSSSEHDKAYEQEKSSFCQHVSAFLKKNSFPSSRRALLGGIELDLYRLYREVLYLGGYKEVVSKPGTWSKIFRTLENSQNGKVTDASYRLKWYYLQSLYAYEQFYFHGKEISSIKVPSKPKRASRSGAGKNMNRFALSFWQQAQMMAQSRWSQQSKVLPSPFVNQGYVAPAPGWRNGPVLPHSSHGVMRYTHSSLMSQPGQS